MSVVFAPVVSTAIADGCPPGASDKEYIKMLRDCIFELSRERAELSVAHVKQVKALKQEIVDLDFRYSGELARVTKELEELKAAPKPMELDGCLAIRALGVAAEHNYVHQHMSKLLAKLKAAQERLDELEKDFLTVNVCRAWEAINEFLVRDNSRLLLDRVSLEDLFNNSLTLGGWFKALLFFLRFEEGQMIVGRELDVVPNPDEFEEDEEDESEEDEEARV
jgi:hypothetical protein